MVDPMLVGALVPFKGQYKFALRYLNRSKRFTLCAINRGEGKANFYTEAPDAEAAVKEFLSLVHKK